MSLKNEQIHDIYHILEKLAPAWPATSLSSYKGKPFHSLITSVLSTQTREEKTIMASIALFQLADNPYDMIKLPEDQIRKAISGCSFYNHKTKYIKMICEQLIEDGGEVSQNIEILTKYKGVGWKVAVLTLANSFGYADDICVDTHVARIGKRLGLVHQNTKKLQNIADELKSKLPYEYWLNWNEFMVKFGREVCRARYPKCEICPIQRYCPRIDVVSHLNLG